MKNRYLLLGELPLIALAAFVAFATRFDWDFYPRHPEFVVYALVALALKPVVFWMFGLYRRYWQSTGIHDLEIVFVAVSVSSLCMAIFVAAVRGTLMFAPVVLFNDWLVTLAAAGGLRVAIRIASESALSSTRSAPAGTPKRILIVGAGAAGAMIARELRRNPQLGMEPTGFLDDDPHKRGKHVEGVLVRGRLADLADVVRTEGIENVVIAMPSARGAVVRAVHDACAQTGVKSQAIPGVYELLDGIATVNRLRNVDIADLLRRSPVGPRENTAAFVKNRVVLITGGGGSIGFELARQVANAAPEHLVLLGHGENSMFEAAARLRRSFPTVNLSTVIADIRDDSRMAKLFDHFRPAIVFHAAAHKHVPLMEENPEEAVTNNIIGTRTVVEHSLRAAAERFVLISTDKAVSPASIMGATKRVAEMIVRDAADRSGKPFVSVRFGNVLGSRGSVVNTFKEQIERGGPVTVTHPDMARFFMTIPEAVHLVLQASGEGKGGDLFVLDMGEPVKIVQLARDLIKLSGLTEQDVPIVFTGTRSGEKLDETLVDAGTDMQRTSHPEILRFVGPKVFATSDLRELVSKLSDAAHRGDRRAIELLLARAIPGFASQSAALPSLVTDRIH